jgi:type VI secretion system protein ImpI
MNLLLEIVSEHASVMGDRARWVVGPAGCRIGRGPGNDWELPSHHISRHHVTVRVLNGMYFVEGKGRVPIAINDRRRELRNDDPHPLTDGDRLFIDDYELRATLVHDAASVRGTAARPTFEEIPDPLDDRPIQTASHDPLDLLPPIGGVGRPQRPVKEPKGSTLAASIEDQAYRPADAVSTPDRLPDDWYAKAAQNAAAPVAKVASAPSEGLPDDWFSASAPATPKPAIPTPVAAPRKPAPAVAEHPVAAPAPPVMTSADATTAILAGAGLDVGQARMPPEVAQQLGAIIRIVVEGTMDVLRARNEMRNQFRMPLTQIARADNNPLKFSADAADALHNLLVKQGSAYLGPTEAFEDAFDEIRLHQLAMLKGIQAGFERWLAILDPEQIQERVDKGGAGGLGALAGRKAKLWDEYVAMHTGWQGDRDDAFRRVFGDEFARAYEEELRAQKTAKRAKRRSGPKR